LPGCGTDDGVIRSGNAALKPENDIAVEGIENAQKVQAAGAAFISNIPNVAPVVIPTANTSVHSR
jgi:hypothetical protein